MDVNEKLFEGCRRGNVEAIKAARSEGAEINQIIDDCTPLIEAIVFTQFEAVKYLCDNGADVNLCVKGGNTPLDMADMYFEEVIDLLRKKGAKYYWEVNSSN